MILSFSLPCGLSLVSVCCILAWILISLRISDPLHISPRQWQTGKSTLIFPVWGNIKILIYPAPLIGPTSLYQPFHWLMFQVLKIIRNFSRLGSPLDLFSTFPTTFWLFPKFLCRSVIFYPHQGNLNNNFEALYLKFKALILAALTWWADIREVGVHSVSLRHYRTQSSGSETRVSHMHDLIWSYVAQHKVRKFEFHTISHSSNIFRMIKCTKVWFISFVYELLTNI